MSQEQLKLQLKKIISQLKLFNQYQTNPNKKNEVYLTPSIAYL